MSFSAGRVLFSRSVDGMRVGARVVPAQNSGRLRPWRARYAGVVMKPSVDLSLARAQLSALFRDGDTLKFVVLGPAGADGKGRVDNERRIVGLSSAVRPSAGGVLDWAAERNQQDFDVFVGANPVGRRVNDRGRMAYGATARSRAAFRVCAAGPGQGHRVGYRPSRSGREGRHAPDSGHGAAYFESAPTSIRCSGLCALRIGAVRRIRRRQRRFSTSIVRWRSATGAIRPPATSPAWCVWPGS